MDAEKMLDIYIYDHLMKRKHNDSARIFLREAGVPPSPTVIDTPGGFLFEWWSVFWDVFIARYKQTGPTNEVVHVVEDHRNLLNQQQLQQLRHNIQLQPSVSSTSLCSQKSNMLNALVKRKLEESRSWPPEKDAFTVEGKKPKCTSEMVGQVPGSSRSLLLRPVEGTDSHVGQMMHDARARSTAISHNQQPLMFPGFVGLMPNIKDTISDGSVYGANVTGPPVNDFPLQGWPLKGQGGFQNFQPQFLKSGQVGQHFAQSIDPSKFVQLPIHVPQLGDQIGGASGSGAKDNGMSCTSVDSSQARYHQIFGKGNHPSSFVDPTNNLGTVKDIGRTSSAVDITPPLTQTTEDMSMTLFASPFDDDTSSNAHVSGPAVVGPQSSEQNQLVDSDKFVNNEHGVDKDECFTHSTIIGGDKITSVCMHAGKDMTLTEVGAIPAGSVNLCDFSLHGKLIASCASDGKVVLWCTESKDQVCVKNAHDAKITDIRFGPRYSRLATSSLDQTVKIWDINNPSKSPKTLKGHSEPVLSLDFHPKKDLLCSCEDSVSGIRYWDTLTGGCIGNSKGGANKVRFQPCHGKYLAAAVENVVSIIDVETAQSCRLPLQGHTRNVVSVCWNSSGEQLVSLSEDVVKVWKFGRGEGKKCIQELSLSGKTFTCCVFHPVIPSVLIIGFNQSMELWDITENKLVSVLRQKPVSTLAVSGQAGLVASAIDDNAGGGVIKLWK